MILEVDQKPGVLDISYLNAEGNKAIMSLPVEHYTQWQVDEKGIGTPGYIDISGKPVVKKWARSFRTFDLLEFLKSQPQNIQDELFAYCEANLVACDIETEIGDRFPKPELAEMPVNAISCVDKNLNILVYTTRPLDRTGNDYPIVKLSLVKQFDDAAYANFKASGLSDNDEVQWPTDGRILVYDNVEANETDDGAFAEKLPMQIVEIAKFDEAAYEQLLAEGHQPEENIVWPTGKWFVKVPRLTTMTDEVNKIIREQVGHLIAPHEKIDVKLLHYDTEKEMLEGYGGSICKFGAVLAFWNGDGFDKPYMFNRCAQLGIPIQSWSITNEMASQTRSPKHTIFVDYLAMIDKYDRSIKNRESLKLDYISFRTLGIGKLPYRGTLKELTANDIPGFLAYNAIDSVLVQLIHRKMNLMATLYGFSHVCKLPLAKANSQVAQTESLVSLDTLDMLDTEGIDMPEKPNNGLIQVAAFDPMKTPRRKYDGGHVKEPFKHVAGWNACIDFSGLYPSVQRSCNISVENYIGNLSQYAPAVQRNILNDKNYFVSINNNVYKNDRAYAYKRIQIFLRAKRDHHKKLMNKHLSLMQPFIEYALWERGVWGEKADFDKSIETLPWTVYIEGNAYTPDLVHLNNPGDQDGYEHHVNFLWFLFHENLRQGFYEMNMQVAYKLVANSLYGATANEFNSFRNIEAADDTTAEGRNSIITAEKIINNWMNFEWANDIEAHKFLLTAFPGQFTKLVEGAMPAMPIRDRVMYCDTDSLYIEYEDMLENTGFTGDPVDFFVALYDGYKQKQADGTDTYVKGYLSILVNQRLHKMVNDRHGQSMMKFDLEHIARVGLFRKKKSYMKSSDWVDGRKYEYEDAFKHLKTTGFALARSFQSQKCRDTARNAIVEILQGKWKTQADYLKNMMALWQDFQTWSIEDISKRMSIRKDQYESHILGLDPYPVFAPRTLPQYRGAAWYNWQLRQRGLTDTMQDIDTDFVVFYEDVNGNPFAFRIFELPAWHPQPNKVMQFYKLLGDVIRDVAIYYGIVCKLPIGGDYSSSDEDDEDEA